MTEASFLSELMLAMGGALFGSIIMLLYKRLGNGRSETDVKLKELEVRLGTIEKSIGEMKTQIEKIQDTIHKIHLYIVSGGNYYWTNGGGIEEKREPK